MVMPCFGSPLPADRNLCRDADYGFDWRRFARTLRRLGPQGRIAGQGCIHGQGRTDRDMLSRITVILAVLLGLLLLGGGAFLAAWDIPAPTSTVEKVLPDSRFPR